MGELEQQKARAIGRNPASHDQASHGIGKQTLAELLPSEPALDEQSGAALHSLANVLQNGGKLGFRWTGWRIGDTSRYDAALETIAEAVRGALPDGGEEGRELSAAERVTYLDAGLGKLAPLFERSNADPGWRAYVATQITPYVARLRARCLTTRAEQRVRNSLKIGDQVMEIPDNASPDAQAPVLRESARRMVSTLATLNEMGIRIGHDKIEETAHHMMGGHGHGGKLGGGTLVDLQHALQLADALLILTDKDLQHELNHPEGFFAGVASVAEVVKASVELLGSSIAMAGYWMAAIGQLTGSASTVTQGLGFARMTGFHFANVIAVVEVVHGCAVLADPHATSQAKEGAAVDVIAGGAWLVRQGASSAAKRAATAEAGAALGEVATVAGAVSIAVVVEYAQLRFLLAQYWTARSALTSIGINAVLADLVEDSTPIVVASERLASAGILAQREQDPNELAALRQAEVTFARELGAEIDSLLSRATATPVAGSGHLTDTGQLAMRPGASTSVRGVFAPLQALRGTSTTPELARRNATTVLDKVRWCFQNAKLLASAEMEGKSVERVQQEQAARKPEGGEGEGGEGGENLEPGEAE